MILLIGEWYQKPRSGSEDLAPILEVTANSSKVVLLTLQLFVRFPVKIFAGLGLPFALDKRGFNFNIVNNLLPNIHPDS